jgi:chorismate mutase/prephenate dehydratase
MAERQDPDRQLNALREQIDAVDEKLLTLLNERAQCASDVARVKQDALEARWQEGERIARRPEEVVFYRPEREAQILRTVMEQNPGPLPADEVAHIFREIMSACLALEQPLSVAYLGPEGTFTQAAAIKHFGHAVLSQSASSIDNVFALVDAGEVNYGVVPVENSTEGMVTHTLDSFIRSSLKICGEVELPIRLHLLVGPGGDAENLRCICAHQQALAQCRHWLERHWPHLEQRAVSSNGEAARMAAAEPGLAAVAGDIACEQYGLDKVASNIQDVSGNTTRFLIIGRESVLPSDRDKTSIIVSSHNKPGALYGLLEPFQRAGIMLTRIDTRPSRSEAWTYLFFMEFEGHHSDPAVQAVLGELEEHTVMLKLLGSYPQAVI